MGAINLKKILSDAGYPNFKVNQISDGNNSFGDLYFQRKILFAALVNAYPEKSWKSKCHFDAKYGARPINKGYFIVGIDTPEGTFDCHFSMENWDLFKCKELSRSKSWDGHTDKDVARVLSLRKD